MLQYNVRCYRLVGIRGGLQVKSNRILSESFAKDEFAKFVSCALFQRVLLVQEDPNGVSWEIQSWQGEPSKVIWS